MEVPGSKDIEFTPSQDAESFRMSRVAALRREIDSLAAQRCAKEEELRRLQCEPRSLFDAAGCAAHPAKNLSSEEKIALFLSLFGARRDVYPRFWENTQSGKKGYSPAYVSEYEAGAFGKRYIRAARFRMTTDDQLQFLFADGHSPQLGTPLHDDPLVSEIAQIWGLPIERKVRIHLKDGENLPVLDGRLELVSAPDLPFDRRQALNLRVRGYVFSSQAVSGWSIAD